MQGAGAIAIMQPYFAPYAGYFRLFASADLFVVYDCVQFPRRGWVHRNRLPGRDGVLRWLTLPLEHAPQGARICDLRFRQDARAALSAQLRRFPSLEALPARMRGALLEVGGTPVDYIERLLGASCELLGLPFHTVRSSSLGIPAAVHGQDRILAIANALGATRYINSPGGRDLYDEAAFAAAGLALEFLPPYPGAQTSVLHRLAIEPARELQADVARSTA